MKTADTPEVHRTLVCQFGGKPTSAPKMQLSSLRVLTFVVVTPLPVQFEGAHIEGSTVLSWAANNTKKLGQKHCGELEAWTLISTREFGKTHKCPQESVPPEHMLKVQTLMLREFEAASGLPSGSVDPCYSKGQLWGAALPMNVMATGSGQQHGDVLDAQRQASVCGDWLVAPSIEGATLSGLALAEAITA